ncbi:MAG: Gfo/Idh/MocA family oxidoreductase [Chloroflexi bacterium]|nr:Gfo/Idh/MocA family oxidoreductase [Chloroflexota bacterium]
MSETIGVGIIGTGLSATMHVQALAQVPGVRVLAVSGTTRQKAAEFAARYGIPAAFDRVEDLLAWPGIQAIHLCTPPFAREEYVTMAARAGVHVLIEKPMARDLLEADRIIAACRAGGVTLGAMFQFRFMPLPQQIKRELDAGKLGRIFLADCRAKWWRDPAYYAGSSWRGRRALEGGAVLINQAIHTIDLLLWLAGPVRQVAGRVATAVHPIEMEDVAAATLEFASGAIGSLVASTATYPGFAEQIELHGERGSLILNQGDGIAEWRLKDAAPERVTAAEQRAESSRDPSRVSLVGHIAEFTDFYEAIRQRRPPAIDGQEGRKALEVVKAIQLSGARGGVPISLPLTGSFDSGGPAALD